MGEYSARPLQPGEVLRIAPNQTLQAGQWLISPNGEYRMGLENGKLVIKHDASPGAPVWEQPGKDGREAVAIVFDTEKDGDDNRLELRDRRDKELWGASAEHEGIRGAAEEGEWEDYDDDADHVPAQYVLTNDGQLLLVKDRLPDDWNGDNLTLQSPNVLWANDFVYAKAAADRREAAAHKRYVQGLDRDPKEGDKLADYRLEIRVPPGTASPLLKSAIATANSQLNYLAFQMGQKKKPDALQSPDKGKDTNPWDDNLRLHENVINSVFLGSVPKPGETGESVDAYKSTESMLTDLAGRWRAMDEKFKVADQALTLDNAQTYKRMYDTVQDAHEKIWAHLKTGTLSAMSGQPPTELYTDFGIQDMSEEKYVYEIIRDTVDSCAKEVADYTNRAAELAKEFGDFPGYPSPKSDGNNGNNGAGNGNNGAGNGNTSGNDANNGDNGANNGNSGNSAAGNGNKGNNGISGAPYVTGNPAAPFNGAPPPVQDTSTRQAEPQNEDLSSTFDDLVGDPGIIPSGDDTPSTVSAGSGETSSRPDFGAVVPAVQRSGAETGSATGTTTGQTAANTPAANGSGIDMGQMMAMAAMAQMANQGNRVPGDDRAHEDRDAREERQRDRDRDRAASVAPATNPGAQPAPPGATAPTYTGSPPPVNAPSGMVDYQIGNSTVQVSPPVAEALQRQTQNTAIDAVAAYAGTAGEPTANQPWATVNDVAQLATGDIVQWEKHSALIVKNENGLNILDNGQLILLEPNNPPLTEKYGSFTGYFHPTGLNVNPDTADAGTAAAPPPPRVSVVQPGGPPSVSLPHV
ncbi:hypothetical protein [Nocardia asiatica]|uniref:hypothetical protein n=1 Tax=Nocardia asiatica TaxID=209252 RepID=UPI0024552136|nr:hypothetical protein [Nocardia asiatica]